MNNTSKNIRRKQANRPAVRRKDFLIGAFAIAAVGIMVLVVILGPKIFSPAPPQEKKVPSALPEQAEEKPVTPEEYRLGKSYVLEHTTDPKTGAVNTQKRTIDDLLIDGNVAIRNRDFASYKKIEDKLLDLGDQVVPDLGEIILYEDNIELATAAARTLGKIGTDKAILQLSGYANTHDAKTTNDKFIAANVVGAIASSGNKHATETLRDILMKGRNPAARAEALKSLANSAKDEQWYKDALAQIANNAQESDILRASALSQLIKTGNQESAMLAMAAYFSMKDAGSKIEIIWAIDRSNADGAAEFFSKVCAQETNTQVLMEALPVWYRLHKNDAPATLVAFLEKMFNRQKDTELTKNIISCLCQIVDSTSLSLLQKIAANEESQAARNLATEGAEYLKQKLGQG